MTIFSPDEYAAQFAYDLHAADAQRPRSAQSDSGQIGVSDIGRCGEYVRRMIARETPSDSPSSRPAMIGTALDEELIVPARRVHPHLSFKVAMEVTLPNGMVIPGTADEVDPTEPSVTDYKTKNGLGDVRSHTGGTQNRWQRQLYYFGLHQSGVLPAEGITRNVYMDRSGSDDRDHVEQEPFDPSIVDEATRWLDGVVEAHLHGDEAGKDVPRPMCKRMCKFYTSCRGGEIDQKGDLITNERVAGVVDTYVDAVLMLKAAEATKDALRDDVAGLTGVTAKSEIVSTWNNTKRGGHWTVTVDTL